MLRAAAALEVGALGVVEDGERRVFGRGAPDAEIIVHDPRFWLDVAAGGSTGLGEAYVAGRWSSPDLVALVRLFLNNRAALARVESGTARIRRTLDSLRMRSRPRGPAGSRQNVAAHYDLGNDFFELVLDPTLSYSCAVFAEPGATLESASRTKIARVLDDLALRPGQQLLEIGTGWGALALAAAERGCHVTTTTLSSAQARFARERFGRAGLADRITLLENDWRELEGRHDALVSIEMLEAVGPAQYDAFFRRCRELLSPGGRMLLQTIVVSDERFERDKNRVGFIKKHVFPGSCIPSLSALRAAALRADLTWLGDSDIGEHYARTLAAWRDNLHDHAAEIRARGYPETLIRTWDYYLAYCEGGFRERELADSQIRLERPR
jgi:cyclopropane-fatty-acyl-phospholipid synthase